MSTVDAGRSNSFTPVDLDAYRESVGPRMTPKPREFRGVCEVPPPTPSALAHYARSQRQIEHSVDVCRTDTPWNTSQLAKQLPQLNEDQRHQVIQRLARGGGERVFYGHDTFRLHNGLHQPLKEDHRVIANNLQSAFASGAIDAKDLLRIADADPDGAQRFMSVLRLGDNSRDANSVAQTLADGLWTRNGADGKDRAEAAMYFTSDPAVMTRTLDTADKRATAFEALVDFNQSKPYGRWPPGVAADWKTEALSAPARLFAAHGQELVDRYTELKSTRAAAPEVLAKFFSHNVMNPDAKGIKLDGQRELVPTVRAALSSAVDTYFSRTRDARNESTQQIYAMRQLGHLTAGVSGAASLALTEYSSKVNSIEEARKEVAGLVGTVAGMMAKPLEIPMGKQFEQLVTTITDSILKDMRLLPEPPNATFSRAMFNQVTMRIAGLMDEVQNPKLIDHFYGPDGSLGSRVREFLNVNPGGHRR